MAKARLPTVSLTEQWLRSSGWEPAYVQRSVPTRPHPTSFDAWGFADFVAFYPGKPGMLAVNACGAGGISAHVTKFIALQSARSFLTCPGNRIVIVAWRRSRVHGVRALPRVRELTLRDFPPMPGA